MHISAHISDYTTVQYCQVVLPSFTLFVLFSLALFNASCQLIWFISGDTINYECVSAITSMLIPTWVFIMAGTAVENESKPIEDSSVLQHQSSHVLDSISHSQLPRESGDIAGLASTSLHPSGPIFIPPHQARPGTGSSTSSIPFSQVPVGSWDTFIHGSCPRCHHWHNRVTLRVSRNPGVFNSIRCEKCAHKWFGIGGNSTHTSLASQESTDNFDENSSVVRGLLLQTMRDMSAVGSPTLAIVQEDPSSATSPLSRHHSSPSSAISGIQTANPPTTILQVPQEGNITILDSRLHLTPSVHETHGAAQIHTKPSNNSSQDPRKNKKNFFTKIIIRNIEKLRGRLRRGKRRSAQNPPATVKPTNPTPTQETRPISPRQISSIEVQQPGPAASNASQPKDDLAEGTPPAAIPDRTGTEPQEHHRRTILEFRDELPRLTHKERIDRLRRTLTEQQTCRQYLRPSSPVVPDNPLVDTASIYPFNPSEESGPSSRDVVPDNPLVDTASIYPSNPSEESGPSFHDLLFIGSGLEVPPTLFTGPRSQNRQEDRTLNHHLFMGSHFETPSYSLEGSNMRHTTPVMRPPRLRNRVSAVLSSLGDRSLSGIDRPRYVDEEEINRFQFIEEKETPPQLYRRSPSSSSPSSSPPSSSQSGRIYLSIDSDSEASVQMSDEAGDSYSDERPRKIEQNTEQLPMEITNVMPEGHSTMEASSSSIPREMTPKIGPSKSTETLLSATVEHTTAASGNSIMPNLHGAVTDSSHQEKDRNDTTGENAEEAAIVSQQLLTANSIRPHLGRSLDTPANTTHSLIDPFCVPIESRNPPGEGRENGAEQCQPVETGPIAVIDSNVSLLERDHSVINPRSTPQGLQLARNKGLLSTSDLQSNAPISKLHISQPPPHEEYCEAQYSKSPSIKSWVLKSIKVLARPRLLPGLRRIEWTCVSFCNLCSF